MIRDFQSATVAGPVSGSSGAYILPVSLAFVDPAVSQDSRYIIFVTGVGNQANAFPFDVLVAFDGNTYIDQNSYPVATTDWIANGLMFLWTSGSGTFDVYYIPSGVGAQSARQVTIAALALCDLDGYEDDGGSTSSTSYVSFTTLNLTVPTDGYYLLCTRCTNTRTGTPNYSIQTLVDGATSYGDAYMGPPVGSGTGNPYACHARVFLTAGAHTIELQHKVDTSGSVLSYGYILALREDELPNVFYAEARGDSTTNSVDPTFTNKLTMGVPAQTAFEHFLLGSALCRQSAATKIMNVRTQLGGTSECDTKNTDVSATVEYNHIVGSTPSPSAVSANSFTVDGARGATGPGSGAMTMSEAAMILIKTQNEVTIRNLGNQKILGSSALL